MTTPTIANNAHLEELAALRAASLDPTMPPCPDWCRLDAGHPWDSIHDDGRESRGHAGPNFGEFVSVGSMEFADAIGEHVYDMTLDPAVEVDTDEQARAVIAHLQAGLNWMQARR